MIAVRCVILYDGVASRVDKIDLRFEETLESMTTVDTTRRICACNVHGRIYAATIILTTLLLLLPRLLLLLLVVVMHGGLDGTRAALLVDARIRAYAIRAIGFSNCAE